MSRRHHHHMQPYDYDHFGVHQRDRDRETMRGIEYQDDSLSSINSEEESYLHHPHTSKDKKPNFYAKSDTPKPNFYAKSEPPNKPPKQDKPPSNDVYHQKEPKPPAPAATAPESPATVERLGRLEVMLEVLMKRYNAPEKIPAENTNRRFAQEPRRRPLTTSLWINNIQEVSMQNNWNEKSTIQYMGTQMSGIIKAWYNSLPKYDYTWPEWKILISKIFPDNLDFITTLKRLVTRLKQADENMATYYFSKMYLIEACKISGEDAVSCLIDGLNNQAIQEQAKLQNFLTPETLYSQLLMSLPDYTVDYSPAVAPSTDAVLNNWYYQEQELNMREVNLEPEAVAPPPPQQLFDYDNQTMNEEFDYQENAARMSAQKRLGTVHSRLDKRFIVRPNQFKHPKLPMAAKVCTICGHRGHLARTCRNANKMMACKTSEHSGAFYKSCTVNGRELSGFIDTGCTTVTIRERDARDLGLIVYPVSDVIEIYGGGKVETVGETQLMLEVDSVKVTVGAAVVPDHLQNVPLIVGQGFLNRKNVCVFLQNETLKIFECSPHKLTN